MARFVACKRRFAEAPPTRMQLSFTPVPSPPLRDDDKVCCATACDGVCATCSRLGSAGTCRPHTSSSDPDNDCPGMQVCNGAYACRDPLVATTSVAPAVCPVITSVSPKLMVLAGGQLTITGTGFDGASIWIGSKLVSAMCACVCVCVCARG